jgi:hypothetical protein
MKVLLPAIKITKKTHLGSCVHIGSARPVAERDPQGVKERRVTDVVPRAAQSLRDNPGHPMHAPRDRIETLRAVIDCVRGGNVGEKSLKEEMKTYNNRIY